MGQDITKDPPIVLLVEDQPLMRMTAVVDPLRRCPSTSERNPDHGRVMPKPYPRSPEIRLGNGDTPIS